MTALRIKAAVRERDGFKCVDCGISQTEYSRRHPCFARLDVHRLTPGSVYTVDGCVALCKACHRRRHKKPAIPCRTIQLPRPLVLKMRAIAKSRGISVTEYISGVLRPAIIDAWPKAIEVIERLSAKYSSRPPTSTDTEP